MFRALIDGFKKVFSLKRHPAVPNKVFVGDIKIPEPRHPRFRHLPPNERRAKQKRLEKRRMHNRMAAKSRRVNRLRAA